MATKTFLDQAGAQYLVNKIQQIIDTKVSAEDAAALVAEAVVPASASTAGVVKVGDGLAIQDGVLSAIGTQSMSFGQITNTPNSLEGYGIEDAASKSELNELRAEVTGVYHFRGAVADRDALAAIQNPEEGDVYNIISDGMNAAWVQPVGGEGFWDEFGSTVDLTGYVREDDLMTIVDSEIDAMFMKYMPMPVATLADIKKAFATTGEVINVQLTDDMVADADLVVPAGKTAKIDLNGQALNMGSRQLCAYGDMVISGQGEIEGTGKAVYCSGGSVVIDGPSITSIGDSAVAVRDGGSVEMIDGEVTAQEVGILGTHGANITVKGGTIKGIDNYAVGGNGSVGYGGTTINIEGGTLIGNITSPGYEACAIYHPNDGALNISGGTIIANGGAGIVMRGGELNMTGGTITVNAEPGTKGWVGDKKTKMNASGIIYDYHAAYPEKDTLKVYVGPDVEINGVDADVQIYKGTQETPDVVVENGANVAIADAPEA